MIFEIVEGWLKLALKTYMISTVSDLNEQLLHQVSEFSLFLTAKCAPTSAPQPHSTPLSKVV